MARTSAIEGAGADSDEGERPVPPTPEELEKLSVFRDFVAGLDLDAQEALWQRVKAGE